LQIVQGLPEFSADDPAVDASADADLTKAFAMDVMADQPLPRLVGELLQSLKKPISGPIVANICSFFVRFMNTACC